MPTDTPAQSVIKRSISLPPALDKGAVKRAKHEHRSVSSYIQSLIARDIESSRKPVAA